MLTAGMTNSQWATKDLTFLVLCYLVSCPSPTTFTKKSLSSATGFQYRNRNAAQNDKLAIPGFP